MAGGLGPLSARILKGLTADEFGAVFFWGGVLFFLFSRVIGPVFNLFKKSRLRGMTPKLAHVKIFSIIR